MPSHERCEEDHGHGMFRVLQNIEQQSSTNTLRHFINPPTSSNNVMTKAVLHRELVNIPVWVT